MERLAVCRICLNGEVQNVTGDMQLQELYERLTRTPFQTSDMRPLSLCFICHGQLNAARRLMLKCLKAEELLTEMLNQMTNGNEEQDITTLCQSARNQWSVCSVALVNIDSTIQNINSEAISTSTEETVALKLQEHYMQEPRSESEIKISTNSNNPCRYNIDNMINNYGDTNVDSNTFDYQDESNKVIDNQEIVDTSIYTPNDLTKDDNTRVCLHNKTNSICDICNIRFKTWYELIVHSRTHTEVKPYVCKECMKTYKRMGHSKIYSHKHIRGTLYTCSICSQTYSRHRYKTHKCMNLKPYPCNNCNKSFTRDVLKSHKCVKIKDNNNLYMCNVCDMRCKDMHDLKTHFSMHLVNKKYTCHICNKTVPGSSYLKAHLRTHTGDKPYGCKICNKYFSVKSYLKIHALIHKRKQPHVRRKPSDDNTNMESMEGSRFVCDVCGKSFRTKPILSKHVALVHIREKPFICDICDKRFSLKSLLAYHIRFHTGERPFSCSLCDKSFHQQSGLMRHNRIHTGEKPYMCNLCGNTFRQKNSLDSHLLTHTGEKPYRCDICEKTYKSSSNLKDHKRLHTGERPYVCDICKKTFNKTCALRRHARVHTSERPYACEFCDEKFKYSSTLNNHLQIHTTAVL